MSETHLKVVYYGPASSGKTANLQALHRMAPAGAVGRLIHLEADARTLFLDLLPVRVRIGRHTVKLRLLTVPGHDERGSTRRVVLRHVDGVVFVADSALSQAEASRESFKNLRRDLAAEGLAPDEIPLVIQYNKRDLPQVRSEDELRALEREKGRPIFRAVAARGEGVMETLQGLVSLMWDRREQGTDPLSARVGLDKRAFLSAFFEYWDPKRPSRRISGVITAGGAR